MPWLASSGMTMNIRYRLRTSTTAPSVASAWGNLSRISSPSHARAQGGDMRHVMIAMPGIQRQVAVQRDGAQLGVQERAGEIRRRQGPQQQHPAAMQRFKQGE